VTVVKTAVVEKTILVRIVDPNPYTLYIGEQAYTTVVAEALEGEYQGAEIRVLESPFNFANVRPQKGELYDVGEISLARQTERGPIYLAKAVTLPAIIG